MIYQSLYRKYRPQHLDEVVGQEHILNVLYNSLTKDMISHAYLFCGPRGTGKTSIAKLFAQSINCEQAGTVACGVCDNCLEGSAGTHPDIVEIDAASNNGVDEIRGLIDKVKYTPLLGKYKVYIIDEVHMLSQGAFNAFLKTLEEPPAHAVFILATTEIHKVIPTIVSRCQRYDFTNINDDAIAKRLNFILDEEGVKAEQGVTQLIASLSSGALRNALTILEQAIIIADPIITLKQIHETNGIITSSQKKRIFTAIVGKDIQPLLNEVSNLLEVSVNIERLMMDLIKTLKDTLVFKYTRNDTYSDYSEKSLIEYMAQHVSIEDLMKMINVLLEYIDKMKFTQNQSSYLELAVISLFNTNNKDFVEEGIEASSINKIQSVIFDNSSDNTLDVSISKIETSDADLTASSSELEEVMDDYEDIEIELIEPYNTSLNTEPSVDTSETQYNVTKPVLSDETEDAVVEKNTDMSQEMKQTFTNNHNDGEKEDVLNTQNPLSDETETEVSPSSETAKTEEDSMSLDQSDSHMSEKEIPVKNIDSNTLLRYMVSANKDLRFKDEIFFKDVQSYKNDFTWARCARLIINGDLVLSGAKFVMISLDNELEAKEVLEERTRFEMLNFSEEIFKERKHILSCTKTDYNEAVKNFIQLNAQGALPQPFDDSYFIEEHKEIEASAKDQRIDVLKDLFGDKLEIVE